MSEYTFTDDGEVAHVLKDGGQMTAEEIARELSAVPVVPEGHYVVPFNPTEKQWSGLARDLIMWFDCTNRPTGKSMYEHLSNCGIEAPEWLKDEIPDIDHVPPKGTRAAVIYKAMIADYAPESDQ